MTEAYQVAIFPHKLRIFVRVFDVVYFCRLNCPAVSLAVLAFVSVSAQDGRTLALPPRGCIVKQHQSFPANSFIFALSAYSLFPVSSILLSLCAAAPPPAAYGAIPSPHPRTQEEDVRKLKAALSDGSKLVCLVAFSSRHHGLLSIYHGLTGHTGHYRFFSKNLLTRFRAASSKCGDPYMRFATCRQVSPSTYRSTIILRTLISRTEDIYSSTSASCS